MHSLDLAALALAGGTPGSDAFAREAQYWAAVVEQEFKPCPLAHLREIDAAEKEPGDEMADPRVDRSVADGVDRFPIAFGAV